MTHSKIVGGARLLVAVLSLVLGSCNKGITYRGAVMGIPGAFTPGLARHALAITLNAAGPVAAFQNNYYVFAQMNCASCHSTGVSPMFAAADVNAAYAAAKPLGNFTAPSASVLVTYAGNGHCGVATCQTNAAAALTALTPWAQAELAAVAPVPTPTVTPTVTPTTLPTPMPTVTPTASPAQMLVNDVMLLQLVNADLSAQSAATQPFLRYFSIEAWNNVGAAPTTLSADTERSALIKMLNLLSTGPTIVQPVAIDAGRFLYRVDMRKLKWTAAAWTNVKATDPYLAATNFPANLAAAANQTVRADWFVTQIPNSAVNAYFQFLGINSDDPTIDALNGVNRFADMNTGAPATVRSGILVSGAEAHNRIVSWHQTSKGHLFKSYNFDTDVGVNNILSHPYKPTTNNPSTPGPYDFVYADSDNIYTLPNGLNGYYTVEGAFQGQVQTQVNAGAGFPGPQFCFQCHDNNTNQIPMADNVHSALAAVPAGTFPVSLGTLLLGMYDNQALGANQAASGAVFGKAYAELKLPAPDFVGINSEVTNVVTNAFSVMLDVQMAAAELGVSVPAMMSAIRGSSELSAALSLLLTTDAAGVPNGFTRRDTWESTYPTLRGLLFSQLAPVPMPTPAPSATPAPTPTPTHKPTFRHHPAGYKPKAPR